MGVGNLDNPSVEVNDFLELWRCIRVTECHNGVLICINGGVSKLGRCRGVGNGRSE